MNSRQENRSKLYFTARIITKCSLECFPSICGEKMSKGFLKFCKLISNLILGQIKLSQILQTCINYIAAWTTLDFTKLDIKKQTSNTIITEASRCSSWKVSSKASITSDFSTLTHQARWKTKTMPSEIGFPTLTSDVLISQPKTN